jgi:hypothetical protein
VIVVIEHFPSIQGIPTRQPQQGIPNRYPKQQIPRQKSRKQANPNFRNNNRANFQAIGRPPQAAQSGFSAKPCAAATAVMHAASRSINEQMHVAKAAHGEREIAGQKYNWLKTRKILERGVAMRHCTQWHALCLAHSGSSLARGAGYGELKAATSWHSRRGT